MDLSKVYQLYQDFEKEEVIFSFNGIVTEEFMLSMLRLIEVKLSNLVADNRLKKRVFSILVECIQNIYHHVEVEHKELKQSSAIIFLVKSANGFLIQTGNYITHEVIHSLTAHIDKVNSLNKEELKELYQQILNDNQRSSKGTAGLGMIDIARKSGNKLEYAVLAVDEEKAFFSLNVRVD